MTFWKPEPSYPSDAFYTVTVKATQGQRARWESAAKAAGMARGAYVALAADICVIFLDAWREACADRDRALHPERRD